MADAPMALDHDLEFKKVLMNCSPSRQCDEGDEVDQLLMHWFLDNDESVILNLTGDKAQHALDALLAVRTV